MITIIAKMVVKKDKIDEFKNLAEKLVRESRKEAGCISYSLFEDIHDGNILTFIEEWQSQEAIELHNNSKHFLEIVPQFSDLTVGQGEVNLYKVILF